MSTVIFKEFLMSLTVTLIVCVLFVLITRSRASRSGLLWCFLIVLMATWAGGVWIRPFGPALADIRWMQFLVVGLLAVLLVALFVPLKPPKGRDETLDQLEEMVVQKRLEKMTSLTLKAVFGVVFCFFIWAVIANYVLG
jgi:hypothetical protein